MLAPGKCLPYTYQWAEKTVPVAEGSSETTTERYMENYKNVSQDIRDQLNAEAEAVQIILTGIDNDIYSTVDACPNACEMWKAIERLMKQVESFNLVQKASGHVTIHQVNVPVLTSTTTRMARNERQSRYELERTSTLPENRGKINGSSSALYYDPDLLRLLKLRKCQKEKEMTTHGLNFFLFKKIYKPTTTTFELHQNTSRAIQVILQESTEELGHMIITRAVNVVGVGKIVGSGVQLELLKRLIGRMILMMSLEEQEWEAHYMYMHRFKRLLQISVDNSGTS
ncbi:hypothetical protein Tco_0900020 [Tanacetum coccineum]